MFFNDDDKRKVMKMKYYVFNKVRHNTLENAWCNFGAKMLDINLSDDSDISPEEVRSIIDATLEAVNNQSDGSTCQFAASQSNQVEYCIKGGLPDASYTNINLRISTALGQGFIPANLNSINPKVLRRFEEEQASIPKPYPQPQAQGEPEATMNIVLNDIDIGKFMRGRAAFREHLRVLALGETGLTTMEALKDLESILLGWQPLTDGKGSDDNG